jgi:hypothetical protein
MAAANTSGGESATGPEIRYETFKKMLVQTVPCQAAALDLRNGRTTVLALRQMQFEHALRPVIVMAAER